jgi:transglutaminase-like putative cysteine protease
MPANYPPARSEWIPNGDAGIAATIAKMRSLVGGVKGVMSLTVRQKTLEAVRGVERGQSEIDAVFHWIKDNIEFRGEHGETLQSPEATLNFGAGDCDDQAMLAAAMLNSLGFVTRFKTIALDDSPDELSHVYIEVMDHGQWTSLDPTVENSYPGWEPENIARAETYGMSGNSNGALGIIGLLALGFFL